MQIKRKMKIGLFLIGVSVILILIFFLMRTNTFFNSSSAGSLKSDPQISQAKESNSGVSQLSKTSKVSTKPTFVALTSEQKKKVEDALLSSDFIKDVPKKNPISIRFFYFDEGYRIWQDRFYLSDGELIDKTEVSIELIIHSKYIDELEATDLCVIVQTANTNGDLGVETELSEGELVWKYKGMISHRDCFGI